MYVKLISSDGHEFIVKREHALTSGTIKAMLSGPGESSDKTTQHVELSIQKMEVIVLIVLLHIEQQFVDLKSFCFYHQTAKALTFVKYKYLFRHKLFKSSFNFGV